MPLFSEIYGYAPPQGWRVPPLLNEPDAKAVPQSWHTFDGEQGSWLPLSRDETLDRPGNAAAESASCHDYLTLVTWNVDAFADEPEARMAGILSALRDQAAQPDVIFFQEVSSAALRTILADSWMRRCWYSSEAEDAHWSGQQFSPVALLSKRYFVHDGTDPTKGAAARIGAIWRVRYPSRFGRDALCFEAFLPPAGACVRFVNVHLDSFPIRPSFRPRQLAIAAQMLHNVGRGVVAGDFNPVLPEDEALVSENRLVDVWAELRPGEGGFTWGIDGQQLFPPSRLDKVAVVGLEAKDIQVIHPELLSNPETDADQRGSSRSGPISNEGNGVAWSDHSGLRCTLGLTHNV